MDRNCVVTGELFPFEFTADFSTFIKVCWSKCYGLDGECGGVGGRCLWHWLVFEDWMDAEWVGGASVGCTVRLMVDSSIWGEIGVVWMGGRI